MATLATHLDFALLHLGRRAAPYETRKAQPLTCKHDASALSGFRMAYANSAKYLIVRTI